MMTPAAIALDWGTTRLRAFLLDAEGAVIEKREASDGIMSVPAGGFPAVLAKHCGDWLAANKDLPVTMAGMIGSRNGWAEAPYADCPAAVKDLAASLISVTREDGGSAAIIPGVAGVFDGAADVMRGEETLIAGIDLEDGLVCLPGTHSKWAMIRGGRIERFSTFMTGEFYAALTQHTILGRLAADPDDAAGFAAGLEASRNDASLLHTAFASRANVLFERMAPQAVRPYLSGLLIGTEVAGALALYGDLDAVHLIASEPQLGLYRQALAARDIIVTVDDPERALVAGLARIAAARNAA